MCIRDRKVGYPTMQLSEVEKCMIAMVDDVELCRMQGWYQDRLKENQKVKT